MSPLATIATAEGVSRVLGFRASRLAPYVARIETWRRWEHEVEHDTYAFAVSDADFSPRTHARRPRCMFCTHGALHTVEACAASARRGS